SPKTLKGRTAKPLRAEIISAGSGSTRKPCAISPEVIHTSFTGYCQLPSLSSSTSTIPCGSFHRTDIFLRAGMRRVLGASLVTFLVSRRYFIRDARFRTSQCPFVRRYLDLVYSTALRRLNGKCLAAEEVTQTFFF